MRTRGATQSGADEDSPPVVIAKLKAIAAWMPGDIVEAYGDQPIWFVVGLDADLVRVFERFPEEPIPKERSAAIDAGLTAFLRARREPLEDVLATDTIEFGYHADATLARVAESFEKDGFVVVGTVDAGAVRAAMFAPRQTRS
jgi:hypothetical protein